MGAPVRAGSRALAKEFHALTVSWLSVPGVTKDAEPLTASPFSRRAGEKPVRAASVQPEVPPLSREASPRHRHLTMLAVAGTGFEPATSGL